MKIRALMDPRVLSPSDPSPAPAPPPPPVAAPPPPPDGEPGGHIALLRAENARRRTEAAEAQAARDAAIAETAKARADAETAIAAAQTAANARIIRAELRAAAQAAGMVDLDGLAMMDAEKAGVKLDEAGNVVGAAEALAAMKTAKPYLFGAATTGNTQTPKPGPTTPKSALDMTPAEVAALRAQMVKAG